MLTSPPRLISPVEEETRDVRAPVWRGVTSIVGGTLGICLVSYLLAQTGIAVPNAAYPVLHTGLVLTPALIWSLVVLTAEQNAPLPRPLLLGTFLASCFVTSGVVYPIINYIVQPERWLPLADPLTRALGYTFSLGVLFELSKYLVIRSIAWNSQIRFRSDAIAYSTAAALGASVALGLWQVLTQPIAPAAAAMSTFSNLVTSLVPSLILAYGLAEARISRASAFLLPVAFSLSTLAYGLLLTGHALLTNAQFTLDGREQMTQPTPLLGLLLLTGVVTLLSLAITFLIAASERRDAELENRS